MPLLDNAVTQRVRLSRSVLNSRSLVKIQVVVSSGLSTQKLIHKARGGTQAMMICDRYLLPVRCNLLSESEPNTEVTEPVNDLSQHF